jgi:hypothetical protein
VVLSIIFISKDETRRDPLPPTGGDPSRLRGRWELRRPKGRTNYGVAHMLYVEFENGVVEAHEMCPDIWDQLGELTVVCIYGPRALERIKRYLYAVPPTGGVDGATIETTL